MKFPTFLPKINLNLNPQDCSRTLGEAGHGQGKKALFWGTMAAVSAIAYVVFCAGFITAGSVLFSPITTSMLIGIPLTIAVISCLVLYCLSIFALTYAIVRTISHVYQVITDAPIKA